MSNALEDCSAKMESDRTLVRSLGEIEDLVKSQAYVLDFDFGFLPFFFVAMTLFLGVR